MKVVLLHSTPWENVAYAARRCYDSHHLSTPAKDTALLSRLATIGHHSIFEHKVYTFDLQGFSRACLQELARHRIASPSVKSTRYTLKELKQTGWNANDLIGFLRPLSNGEIPYCTIEQLRHVKKALDDGMSSDDAKMILPENYKTSAVWTINFNSLMNFINLRVSSMAHYDIRELAVRIADRALCRDKIALDIYHAWRSDFEQYDIHGAMYDLIED